MATLYPTIRVVDADGAPVTGDADNLTLVVLTDGTAVAYAGTITEATTGEYKVGVTQAGILQAVTGVSSTEGAIVVPARWYNAAVAGDEMDLVDAPNATAVTAIQDGLSKTSDPINFIVTGDTIVDGDLRIEAPRGDTYTYAWTCIDANSAAVDLSGYDDYILTVKPVEYRADTDDANAVFQVAGILSGDDNNVLTFSLTVGNTEACDLNTWYDADIEASTTGRTSVSTLATGRYRSTLDVTRTTPE